MGWWKINSVECGGIDLTHGEKQGRELANALPGVDKPEELYNGDGPADVMDAALKKIVSLYDASWKRPPKEEELKAVFNFCSRGLLKGLEKKNKGE